MSDRPYLFLLIRNLHIFLLITFIQIFQKLNCIILSHNMNEIDWNCFPPFYQKSSRNHPSGFDV